MKKSAPCSVLQTYCNDQNCPDFDCSTGESDILFNVVYDVMSWYQDVEKVAVDNSY